MNLMSFVSKIRYNVGWGLPNLIATDRSAIHEEDTIAILLRTRYCNSLPLITMDQGPYYKDPGPWKSNVYIRCHEETVHGPWQTVRLFLFLLNDASCWGLIWQSGVSINIPFYRMAQWWHINIPNACCLNNRVIT
jgi:hypothetical protein